MALFFYKISNCICQKFLIFGIEIEFLICYTFITQLRLYFLCYSTFFFLKNSLPKRKKFIKKISKIRFFGVFFCLMRQKSTIFCFLFVVWRYSARWIEGSFSFYVGADDTLCLRIIIGGVFQKGYRFHDQFELFCEIFRCSEKYLILILVCKS